MTPTTTNKPSTLDLILAALTTGAGIATQIVAGDPQAASFEAIGEDILALVKSAVAAYEQHTGQPIDLNVLQPIDPVPDPAAGIPMPL